MVSTLVDTEVSAVLAKAEALVLDCFQIFIAPLEQELGMRSSHAVGRSHSVVDNSSYFRRIDAVNFALAYDDGQATKELNNADVVLVGVSRVRQDPHLSVPRPAVWHPRRQLPADPGGLRQPCACRAR